MNTSVLLALESALVAHLGDGRLPFAASVVGASNPRVTDEEQYGILGQYVAVPAVIVTAEGNGLNDPNAPVMNATATITVRDSSLQVSVATHRSHATTVSDELWDIGLLSDAIGAADGITLTSVFLGGETFTKPGRAYETAFQLNFIVSGKDNS